ncbi:MAG: hypothetical protein MP439_09230 [Ferrimicrobium sp.]|nr:hypothetical protein [Ferrimicrobium sp.]
MRAGSFSAGLTPRAVLVWFVSDAARCRGLRLCYVVLHGVVGLFLFGGVFGAWLILREMHQSQRLLVIER